MGLDRTAHIRERIAEVKEDLAVTDPNSEKATELLEDLHDLEALLAEVVED